MPQERRGVKRVLVAGKIVRRHHASERVSASGPFPYLGELLPYAVGGVRVKHGEVERRLYQHAKDPELRTPLHQRAYASGSTFPPG